MEREQLVAACTALPLFPLPGVMLIPGTTLPLHVFEPRYRQLVKDCVESGGPLALPQVVVSPGVDLTGAPPLHPYAGVGFVRMHHSLPDGRYNIFVQGLARVKLSEELAETGHPYRVARAILLEDDPYTGDELGRVGMQLRGLIAPLLARGGERGRAFLSGLSELDPARVPDALAPMVLPDDESRQGFLRENHPLRRARMVEEKLLTAMAEGAVGTAAEA
jgi:hypothetical protein